MLFYCYVPLKKKAYSSFLVEAAVTSSGGAQILSRRAKLSIFFKKKILDKKNSYPKKIFYFTN